MVFKFGKEIISRLTGLSCIKASIERWRLPDKLNALVRLLRGIIRKLGFRPILEGVNILFIKTRLKCMGVSVSIMEHEKYKKDSNNYKKIHSLNSLRNRE